MTTRRQKAAANRTAGFWAAKESRARQPVDRAAVAWDRLRHAVQNLDVSAGERDQIWAAVERRLDGLRVEVTGSEVNTRPIHIRPGSAA